MLEVGLFWLVGFWAWGLLLDEDEERKDILASRVHVSHDLVLSLSLSLSLSVMNKSLCQLFHSQMLIRSQVTASVSIPPKKTLLAKLRPINQISASQSFHSTEIV
jgi:hypothetical protein